jgi:hypothetical protein
MEATTQSVTTPTTEKGVRQRGAVDRDLYCSRLDAYLGGAAAAHGLRGNLASVVSSIERGGVGGGGEDPNLAMLRRIGWQEGRHDDFDPARQPGRVIEHLRDAERRFRLLSRKHQGTHLAHYLGTSRCHPTLLATFGDLDGGGVAGVVLERWLTKKAKERARAGNAEQSAALVAVRAELAPLERAMAEAEAVLDQPLTLPDHEEPCPVAPDDPPLVLSRRAIAEWWAPYRAALRAWRAPAAFLTWQHQERRREALQRLQVAQAAAAPLRAEQARLCAELAASAAATTAAGDEQALVALCQKLNEQGQEGRERRDDMIRSAEGDVRAAHRAWRETAPKKAQTAAQKADLKRFKEALWG